MTTHCGSARALTRAEILKHPLQTAVTVNAADFDELSVQAQLHVAINVKDFKAIVSHADTLSCPFNALFSQPGRPLQFQYGNDEMECSFTLMTINDGRVTTPAPAPKNTHQMSTRATKKQAKSVPVQAAGGAARKTSVQMPPPPVPNGRKTLGRAGNSGSAPASQGLPQRNIDPESLFVQQDEDDSQWDPAKYDEGEGIGWDASADNVRMRPSFSLMFTHTAYRTLFIQYSKTRLLRPEQRRSKHLKALSRLSECPRYERLRGTFWSALICRQIKGLW